MKQIITICLAGMFGTVSIADPTTQTAAATTRPAAIQPALVQKLPIALINPGFGDRTGDRYIESGRLAMERLQKSVTQNPPKKIEKLSDVFSMTYVGDWLDVTLNFPEEFGASFQFQVGDDPAFWGGSSYKYKNINPELSRTQHTFSRYNFDSNEEGHIYQVSVITSEKSLSLSGQGIAFRVSLIESMGVARLSVYGLRDGKYMSLCSRTAANFRQLEQQYPNETRQYLSPMLFELSGKYYFAPGATDVYSAFPELKPSADIVDQIKKILPRLDDDEFEVRDAAGTEIADFGAKGAHAILHLDRSTLSDEQKDRIEVILARQQRLFVADSHKLRQDASFLVDCLTYEDESV